MNKPIDPKLAKFIADSRAKGKQYPQSQAHEQARLNAIKMLGLHEHNTAQDRAKAMGINTDVFHGSKQDIRGGFQPGYDDNLAFVTPYAEFANKWIGKGKHHQRIGDEAAAERKAAEDKYREIRLKHEHYDNALEGLQGEEFNKEYDRRRALSKAASEKEFGTHGTPDRIHSTVYPMKVRANKTFNPETDMHVMEEFFQKHGIPQKNIDLYKTGNYMMYETNPVVDYLKSKGYDSMRLRESTDDNYPTIAVFDPAHVRSRFAAFDPARQHENDLLANRGGSIARADGGQVPSPPTPDMLAKLMQLRDQLKPLVEANERRQQGIANMEKANGPLRLPTDQKAKGGPIHLAIGGQGPRNWMKGVEDVINPLKRPAEPRYRHINDQGQAVGQGFGRPMTEAELQQLSSDPSYGRNQALNQWIDRNLGNYIRKQMATPNDPIRKLAEEGITHMPPDQMGFGQDKSIGADMARKKHGGERLAKSDAAKSWEDATDIALSKTTVGDVLRLGQHEGMKKHVEPWMEKADPKTELFHPTDNMHAHYLGFDHLVDILKQDLDRGHIRPDQLSKISIEHAVRRAHEHDQERKKAMAETALKATEGMPVHKEYPEGYKWIELAMNPELPEGHTQTPSGTYVDPEGNESIYHPNYAKLDDALKYEGDTMGHCVGGYTPDVASGKTRIFSLRDAKNEPHVTVEVKPNNHLDYNNWYGQQPTAFKALINAKKSDPNYDRYAEPAYLKARSEQPLAIKQIKGKGNAKPKKDYIPYVQDFVKSGNWSDVGDLKNAEMKQPAGFLRSYLEEKGVPHTKYMTEKEHDAHEADYLLDQLKHYGKAHGGIIHKAEGGSMDTPDLAQARFRINQKANPALMDNIGIDEALDMSPKTFITPEPKMAGGLPVGGIDKVGGLPIGGVDQSSAPGMQFAPQAPQQPQQSPEAPQGGQPPSAGASSPAQQPPSNILSLTPQGRALGAMAPQGMAKGGSMTPKQKLKMYMDMAQKNSGVAHFSDGGSDVKRGFTPKLLESTTQKMLAQVTKDNPKLSLEDAIKRAQRMAEAKLKWEKESKPALTKQYGELEKAKYNENLSKRMKNVPEVVEERKRKANEFLAQPTESWKPPAPELQAFDRNKIKDALEGFPGIEQTAFPRDTPPRANLSHVHEVYEDPENRELIKKQISRGLPLGGETFYASLYPLKLASLEAGHDPKAFDRFIHSIAPASARNSIMNEMAVGQFIRNMHAHGIPLTEENVRREMDAFKQKHKIGLPLMPVHLQGVKNVLENNIDLREQSKANIPTNYKIPTYGTQKAGDFGRSMVLDVHEAGGQTQGSPYHPYFNEQGGFSNPEYGAAEQHMMNIADEMGIPGGMAQAGRWFGGGELTGLRSPRGDALDLLEKQSAYTLHHQGISPTPSNIRKHVLEMIGSGKGVLLPYFKKEGMQDLRQSKADGGSIKPMEDMSLAEFLHHELGYKPEHLAVMMRPKTNKAKVK